MLAGEGYVLRRLQEVVDVIGEEFQLPVQHAPDIYIPPVFCLRLVGITLLSDDRACGIYVNCTNRTFHLHDHDQRRMYVLGYRRRLFL